MSEYVIKATIKDIADGDAEDIAQAIYDEHAEGLDADRGDFVVTISKDGFAFDWEPVT